MLSEKHNGDVVNYTSTVFKLQNMRTHAPYAETERR